MYFSQLQGGQMAAPPPPRSPMHTYERLTHWDAARQRKMRDGRIIQYHQQFAECTFAPSIDTGRPHILAGRATPVSGEAEFMQRQAAARQLRNEKTRGNFKDGSGWTGRPTVAKAPNLGVKRNVVLKNDAAPVRGLLHKELHAPLKRSQQRRTLPANCSAITAPDTARTTDSAEYPYRLGESTGTSKSGRPRAAWDPLPSSGPVVCDHEPIPRALAVDYPSSDEEPAPLPRGFQGVPEEELAAPRGLFSRDSTAGIIEHGRAPTLSAAATAAGNQSGTVGALAAAAAALAVEKEGAIAHSALLDDVEKLSPTELDALLEVAGGDLSALEEVLNACGGDLSDFGAEYYGGSTTVC